MSSCQSVYATKLNKSGSMSEVATRNEFSNLLPGIRFKAWFNSSLRNVSRMYGWRIEL